MKIKDLETCPALLEESSKAKKVGLYLHTSGGTKRGNRMPNNFNALAQNTTNILKSQTVGYAQSLKALTTA
ncbi:MAG: hypothetical protein AAGE84_22605 [Cyanobacteria bacterium P01_G01_bin.39]